MTKISLAIVIFAIGLGAAALATGGNNPPGRDPCSHGATGKPCRPDPQPGHGKDCDHHGNHGGVNEDHCLGTTTSPGTTNVTTTSPGQTKTTVQTITQPGQTVTITDTNPANAPKPLAAPHAKAKAKVKAERHRITARTVARHRLPKTTG